MIFRKVLAVVLLMTCGSAIAFTFWNQELKFLLPTPVPLNYQVIAPGQQVTLPGLLGSGNAYFLHFYNPDCPCSRFNAQHIQSLIKSYGDSMKFVIIVPDAESMQRAQSTFGADLDYKIDTNDLIAQACGVYSTPQAAIIDSKSKLFYRGNYNRARYCTDRATNFAELSLIALLNNQSPPLLDPLSIQSYGCTLSNDPDVEFF